MQARRGIIFDLDNTLIRSNIDFRRMARALVDFLQERLGGEAVPAALADRPIAEIVEAGSALRPALGPELWRIVAEHEAMGMQDLELEDGAREVVERLAGAGHLLAICTNNARPATMAALRPFGEPLPFDPVISRDEVRRLKPAPEGLLRIKELWAARGVEASFMVGDSWLDGKAAELAGIPFVEYRGRPSRVPREPIPVHHRIEHLMELYDIVGGRGIA